MNFFQKIKLKRKIKKILKLFDELDKNLSEFENMLFKFGLITKEDIRKKAEEEAKRILADLKLEQERKLNYIA